MRRFRFRLGTLLILIIVLGVGLAIREAELDDRGGRRGWAGIVR
jgi:hypothetical protein